MSEYNLVQIGTTWLTSDGTETGTPCRTEVTGIDALRFSFTGANQLAADGSVYSHIIPNNRRGLPIDIKPLVVMKDTLDSIIDDIEDAVSEATTITVSVTGDTGSYSLECVPVLPKPVEFPGTFSDERIDGVVFRFLVESLTEV